MCVKKTFILGYSPTILLRLTPFKRSLKSSAVKASKDPAGKTSNKPSLIWSSAFSWHVIILQIHYSVIIPQIHYWIIRKDDIPVISIKIHNIYLYWLYFLTYVYTLWALTSKSRPRGTSSTLLFWIPPPSSGDRSIENVSSNAANSWALVS